MTLNPETPQRSKLLIAAGFLIGAGMLGGFVDGIFLHQILQWHHMITNVQPATNLSSLERNTLDDGLFNLGSWIVTLTGIALLWRAGGRSHVIWSSKVFGGSLLLGAGLFDLVEGLINHQILGIHHVKPGINQLAWDLGFLGFGITLIAVGLIMLRLGEKENAIKG
jgi:uncharacterized membrane protein